MGLAQATDDIQRSFWCLQRAYSILLAHKNVHTKFGVGIQSSSGCQSGIWQYSPHLGCRYLNYQDTERDKTELVRQETQPVREKTEVVLQAVSFLLEVLSFLIQALSFVNSGLTKDTTCKRKDRGCITSCVFCGFWPHMTCKRKDMACNRKDTACKRKDRTCKNRFICGPVFSYNLCLFSCKLCLLRGQNPQKTELVIEKTRKGCITGCGFSLASFVFCKSCLFYYKLCLLWILASQKTRLAREKTELVRKDRTTNEAVSFLLQALSCTDIAKTQLVREKTELAKTGPVFSYKLCLLSCKFCLLRSQNPQKTELVREKTQLAITKDRGCITSCVFLLQVLSFERPKST